MTASGSTISATAQHYLYHNNTLVQAQHIKLGDALQLADGSASVVIGINHTQAEGLYSPFTMHGDIVVDGVQASCYSADVSPAIAHALSWPLRLAHSAGFTLLASAPRDLPFFTDLLYALAPKGTY